MAICIKGRMVHNSYIFVVRVEYGEFVLKCYMFFNSEGGIAVWYQMFD